MSIRVLEEAARADGVSGFVVLAIVYAVMAVIGKIKAGSQPRPGQPPVAEPKPRPRQERLPGRQPVGTYAARDATAMRTVRAGNTQLEARKLEELLRVLGQNAEQRGQGPMGRRSAPIPGAEEVEEAQSLEVQARVTDLEALAPRDERRVVDFDDEAEKIVKDRIAAASARNRTLNKADHLAFDERIRRVAADKTAVATASRKHLRDAIVWREILSPPLALRDREEREG